MQCKCKLSSYLFLSDEHGRFAQQVDFKEQALYNANFLVLQVQLWSLGLIYSSD